MWISLGWSNRNWTHGLIGWGALNALNPDKSRRSFPPKKGVERTLILGGAIFGIVVGITGKWC